MGSSSSALDKEDEKNITHILMLGVYFFVSGMNDQLDGGKKMRYKVLTEFREKNWDDVYETDKEFYEKLYHKIAEHSKIKMFKESCKNNQTVFKMIVPNNLSSLKEELKEKPQHIENEIISEEINRDPSLSPENKALIDKEFESLNCPDVSENSGLKDDRSSTPESCFDALELCENDSKETNETPNEFDIESLREKGEKPEPQFFLKDDTLDSLKKSFGDTLENEKMAANQLQSEFEEFRSLKRDHVFHDNDYSTDDNLEERHLNEEYERNLFEQNQMDKCENETSNEFDLESLREKGKKPEPQFFLEDDTLDSLKKSFGDTLENEEMAAKQIQNKLEEFQSLKRDHVFQDNDYSTEDNLEERQLNEEYQRNLFEQNRINNEHMEKEREKRKMKQEEYEKELKKIREEQKAAFRAIIECIRLKAHFEETEFDWSSWINEVYRTLVVRLLTAFTNFEGANASFSMKTKNEADINSSMCDPDFLQDVSYLHQKVLGLIDDLKSVFTHLEQLSSNFPNAIFIRVLNKSVCDTAEKLYAINHVSKCVDAPVHEWFFKLREAFSAIKTYQIPTTRSLRQICKNAWPSAYEDIKFPINEEDGSNCNIEEVIEIDGMEQCSTSTHPERKECDTMLANNNDCYPVHSNPESENELPEDVVEETKPISEITVRDVSIASALIFRAK